MSYEAKPESPPLGYMEANPMDNTLSEGGQWIWIDGQWIENSDYGTDSGNQNPIVEADLEATLDDRLFFQNNPEEQYVGSYHRHQNDMLMTGAGMVGFVHDEINPDEVLFKKIGDRDIKETRERVSDLFYKLWFQSNTFTEQDILDMQTTIRDGIKQTGRGEDEPLVFYKKDRNTLESRKDLQGETFEQICQYIFDSNIDSLEGLFSIEQVPGPIVDNQDSFYYRINFSHGTVSYQIRVAEKVGDTFTDVLNLSQLTKPKTSTRINPEKAREVLDTNIFELLPNQTTRQDTINSFFNQFNELIGPKPAFQDVDGDGAGEVASNYEQDEQRRISYENQRNAYITRLEKQAEGDTNNQGKTLESMRNKLNTYLGDVDNVIQTLEDTRPEYENVSQGFLQIRKPNQAIILKAPNDGLLEFQKNNSYLVDGFTITMWVKFVSKKSEGTLFNFGNPLTDGGVGFRLDTKVNEYEGKFYRYIRLMVRDTDNELYDNHFGVSGINRFGQRSRGGNSNTVAGGYGWWFNATDRPLPGQGSGKGTFWDYEYNLPDGVGTDYPRAYYPDLHRAFPQVSTDNLDEWYFICATFDPTIVEPESSEMSNYGSLGNVKQNKQFWLNHVALNGDIVSNSGFGAKCKVEIISRSELLNARGYIGKPLTVSSKLEDTLDLPSLVLESSFTYEIIENLENLDSGNVSLPISSFQYQIV